MSGRRTYVSVDLSDFTEEDILAEADYIRSRKLNAAGRIAHKLDVGEMVIWLGAWQAFKLREAIQQGYAYEVMDIIKDAIEATDARVADA